MFDTYTAAIGLAEAEAAWEADCEKWDRLMPGWDVSQARADGLLLDSLDFPLSETDEGVPAEDWEAMAEEMWVDPAERHW